MSKIPSELRYTKEHEWAQLDGDVVRVGITDYAQDHLGDVVMVELPTVGQALEADKPFGALESPKSVSDLFAPLAGTVSKVNEALDDAPEKVNEDCYGEGWICELTPADPGAFDGLMDAAAYEAFLASLDD